MHYVILVDGELKIRDAAGNRVSKTTTGAVRIKWPKRRHRKVAPIGLRDKDAAAYLSISTASLHRLVAAGKMPPPLRVGGCRVFDRRVLGRWLAVGCPTAEVFSAIERARQTRGK